MSEYREGSVKRKAVQRGIVEPRPQSGKSKRPAPIALYGLMQFAWWPKAKWTKVGDYRDENTARSAAKARAKYDFYRRFRLGKDGHEFDPRTN